MSHPEDLNGHARQDLPAIAGADATADEVDRRLAGYASARLTPDPARMATIRAGLLAEARARAGGRPMPAAASRAAAARAGWLGLLLRRPALAAAGAILVAAVGTGAALAASGPGGLLYPVRLWAETLTLPSAPGPRTDAELSRLGSRVADAQGAVGNANAAGVAAALNAYTDELAAAQTAAGGDPARLAEIAAALEHHRDVLAALLANVPANADPAIAAALARAEAQINAVLAGSLPGTPPSSPPGQASSPPGQASTPPGQASGNPGNASAHPSHPPKPSPSPQGQGGPPSPHPTPKASPHS